jgi:hypothetical protein
MTTACMFPDCAHVATTKNRKAEPTCALHARVVVAGSGSFVDDRHPEGGHG